MTWEPPTTSQLNYFWALATDLRLTQANVERLAEEQRGVPWGRCGKADVSVLIHHLKAWQSAPEQLQRWLGVVPLFDLEAVS